jgi:hypothetical protein
MNLGPADQEKLLELLADRLAAHITATIDLRGLITLPLDTAAQCLGVSARHVARILPTRPMGARKLGVRLSDLIAYQEKKDPTP